MGHAMQSECISQALQQSRGPRLLASCSRGSRGLRNTSGFPSKSEELGLFDAGAVVDSPGFEKALELRRRGRREVWRRGERRIRLRSELRQWRVSGGLGEPK